MIYYRCTLFPCQMTCLVTTWAEHIRKHIMATLSQHALLSYTAIVSNLCMQRCDWLLDYIINGYWTI